MPQGPRTSNRSVSFADWLDSGERGTGGGGGGGSSAARPAATASAMEHEQQQQQGPALDRHTPQSRANGGQAEAVAEAAPSPTPAPQAPAEAGAAGAAAAAAPTITAPQTHPHPADGQPPPAPVQEQVSATEGFHDTAGAGAGTIPPVPPPPHLRSFLNPPRPSGGVPMATTTMYGVSQQQPTMMMMTPTMMTMGWPAMPSHPIYMQPQQQQQQPGMMMALPMGPPPAPCYGSPGVGGQPFLLSNPPMVGPSIAPPPQGMASWCHPKQSPFFAGSQGSLLNPPAHVLQQQQQQHYYPGQPLYMPFMHPYQQQQYGPAVTVMYHHPRPPPW